MDIKSVVVKTVDVLGDKIRVAGFDEHLKGDNVKVPFRVFQMSSKKEPSCFLIVEELSKSDNKYNGRSEIKLPEYIAMEQRTFSFKGKQMTDVVFVAENMELVK